MFVAASDIVFTKVRDSTPLPLQAEQPPVGQDVLVIETSRSHSDTSHSVELLWMRDHFVAETTDCTTHSTHNRQTSMPSAGFETPIRANERRQIHALDRAANGIETRHTRTAVIDVKIIFPSRFSRVAQ